MSGFKSSIPETNGSKASLELRLGELGLLLTQKVSKSD
jgi:hypothetical protein